MSGGKLQGPQLGVPQAAAAPAIMPAMEAEYDGDWDYDYYDYDYYDYDYYYDDDFYDAYDYYFGYDDSGYGSGYDVDITRDTYHHDLGDDRSWWDRFGDAFRDWWTSGWSDRIKYDPDTERPYVDLGGGKRDQIEYDRHREFDWDVLLNDHTASGFSDRGGGGGLGG